MNEERFLVTGANGCIGSWVVRHLVREGARVVALDIAAQRPRWDLVMSPDEIAAVEAVTGDIADLEAVERVVDGGKITHVIHLAALQVPFCRADPPLGARVNVVGTVNVFEAAVRHADRVAGVVYASSIAAYDALDDGSGGVTMAGTPGTIYGVYKRACEGAASVYWRESGLASVGLRPHTIFGPGRDQGLTSAPTVAMLAAAAGAEYEIPYGGGHQYQYAPDAAAVFVAAARAETTGASVHNLAGHVVDMDELVDTVTQASGAPVGSITYGDGVLPFPSEVDATSLAPIVQGVSETPFADGVAETVGRFRELLESGRIAAPE